MDEIPEAKSRRIFVMNQVCYIEEQEVLLSQSQRNRLWNQLTGGKGLTGIVIGRIPPRERLFVDKHKINRMKKLNKYK